MAIPKKILRIFSEPDAKIYSCGNYTMADLEKNRKIYSVQAQRLVDALGLKSVREILVAYINDDLPYDKTFDEKMPLKSVNDRREKPYIVSNTILDGDGSSIGIPHDVNEFSNIIDRYMSENMDSQALGVIHPALVDLVQFMVKGKYNTQLMKTNSDKPDKSKI